MEKKMVVEIDVEKLHYLVDEGEFVMKWGNWEITDPFFDEFGREPVHPVAYYGNDFILACMTYGLLKYPTA